MYAARNCFVSRENSETENSDSQERQEYRTALESKLAKVMQENFRLEQTHELLLKECNSGSEFAKELRSLLFELKLGLQSYESNNVTPLLDNVSSFLQKKEDLKLMQNKAISKII